MAEAPCDPHRLAVLVEPLFQLRRPLLLTSTIHEGGNGLSWTPRYAAHGP